MKHPIYNTLSILACGYLALANTRGWSILQSSSNRSAIHSTSYRYRPAISSSSGGWSFGSGFHK
ncbi:MAG: hypothetical protein IPK32_25790 [Verrucomicrobiaceae bacterium]|nr:hypothetical protein [Verrucomicrobiaceae bacterium]